VKLYSSLSVQLLKTAGKTSLEGVNPKRTPSPWEPPPPVVPYTVPPEATTGELSGPLPSVPENE
jgi:hypothetical protein